MVKILVCGGRDFTDRTALYRFLDNLHAVQPIAVVVHGAARGADQLAGAWARCMGIEERPYPALWGGYDGHRAGPIRNQKMLDQERPDLVVAFPGGRGTADMVARSQAAGVRVLRPLATAVRQAG